MKRKSCLVVERHYLALKKLGLHEGIKKSTKNATLFCIIKKTVHHDPTIDDLHVCSFLEQDMMQHHQHRSSFQNLHHIPTLWQVRG